MAKVYESLKDVVHGTLQLSKVNSKPLARLKGTTAHTLNDEMDKIEKFVADKIARLKAAVMESEAIVAEETQHAEQVTRNLKANITALEDKLRESEDNLRKGELASQRMEESVTRKIQDLQIEIKKKEKSLESRGNEVKDLKSKIDTLERQATQLQQAIQQAKQEAASEAKRVEHLTETFKAKIVAQEAQLSKTEEIVREKDSTIKALEENFSEKTQDLESQVKSKEKLVANREKHINDLNSQIQVLTKGIKDMSSFFRRAEALAALETQDIGTALEASESTNEQDKPTAPQIDSPQVVSNKTEKTQETVAPEFFDRVTNELTQVIGPMASMIVRDHVAAFGESMEKFPQVRVMEFLKIVSEEIPDKNRKTRFRERLATSPAAVRRSSL